MEPLFEVRYYDNHKMIAEFARKYLLGPRMPVLVVFWVFFAVFLALSIQNGTIYDRKYMLFVFGIFMLTVSFLPHLYARGVIQGNKKQNDGILPETVVIFGDTIEIHEGMVHLTIEYRKIVRTIRLKHSYMLMLGKRNGVMLDPNGFTKGSFEEFKQFLRTKCPGIIVVE